MSSVVAYKAPEIPSKWDIIPIHNSDRASFKRCRRYWNWSSPARNNYMLRADIFGVNTDLWFGTGIHWALEQFYQPGIKRDPVEAFKTWFDIQWRGGVVTAEWLPRVYDLSPLSIGNTPANHLSHNWHPTDEQPTPGQLYKVRGLEDILPDPDAGQFDELYELGMNMMQYYRNYAADHDAFDILVTEHDFSIPVWDYKNDTILRMTDLREDSPNYGKELEVHMRGRTDALGIWHENEKLFVHDYKTAAKIGEDYFEKLETDEQCTNYLYAIEIEANYYDLPYRGTPVEEVLYTALRKKYPKPPTELKNGMFSIDRENESTTHKMLMAWIARNMPGVPLSEKQQAYIDWLWDVGDEQFIMRRTARRNRYQIANAGFRLYQESLDMLKPDLPIYPNITNDWLCLRCQFRAPCLMKEDSPEGTAEQYLKDNYTTNKDR